MKIDSLHKQNAKIDICLLIFAKKMDGGKKSTKLVNLPTTCEKIPTLEHFRTKVRAKKKQSREVGKISPTGENCRKLVKIFAAKWLRKKKK